jgi:hypothetical protein
MAMLSKLSGEEEKRPDKFFAMKTYAFLLEQDQQ